MFGKLSARAMLCACFLIASALLLAAAVSEVSGTAEELWELNITLSVPRIYDNMASLGSRRYQTQRLRGYFTVTPSAYGEPVISLRSLENRTHKIRGKSVTYDTEAGYCLWHGIGSNLTGLFKTRSVVLNITAEPSYALGEVPTEDNSLLLTLSGRSTGSQKRLNGYAAGQLGCGCYEYGHISPTRIWGSVTAVDTAAVFGTWSARMVK